MSRFPVFVPGDRVTCTLGHRRREGFCSEILDYGPAGAVWRVRTDDGGFFIVAAERLQLTHGQCASGSRLSPPPASGAGRAEEPG